VLFGIIFIGEENMKNILAWRKRKCELLGIRDYLMDAIDVGLYLLIMLIAYWVGYFTIGLGVVVVLIVWDLVVSYREGNKLPDWYK
jgi:hypothetical protein